MDMSYLTGTTGTRFAWGPWRPSRYTAQATRTGGRRCRDTRGTETRGTWMNTTQREHNTSTRHITSE